MKHLYNNPIIKWYLRKYWGIPEEFEIIRIQKTAVKYWKDKKNNIAVSREFGRNLIDIPDWLKHLFHLWDMNIANKYFPFLNLGYDTDTASVNNKDSAILDNLPNNNCGACTLLLIRWKSAVNCWRMVYDWTLSSGSGTISAVKLYLRCVDTSGSPSYQIDVHELTQAFVEGTGADNYVGGEVKNGVTWNAYQYSGSNPVNWTTPGGDFSATVVSSATATWAVNTWYSWDLGPGATNPISGLTWGSNFDILMKKTGTDTSGGNDAYVVFASREHATTTIRPYIEITYTPIVRRGSAVPLLMSM